MGSIVSYKTANHPYCQQMH